MNRALIIRAGAVGDVILTLPVLAALKHHYPDITIDVLGNTTNLALAIEGGYAQTAFSVDGREMTSLFIKNATPSRTICQMMKRYDLVVSYLPDPDGVFRGQIRRLSGGQIVNGNTKPPPHQRTHMSRVLMSALQPLNIKTDASVPELRVAPSPVPEEFISGAPLIVVHPGSGGKYKCWPLDRYAALIHRIADQGYRPVITAGPGDDETLHELLGLIDVNNCLIYENRSLKEIADLLTHCRAMIGNDTGITHLAAAIGAPTVALFGPTDPAVWGPRGRKVRTLWGSEVIEEDVGVKSWEGPYFLKILTEIEVDLAMAVLEEVGRD
jgi:heptosyltransferase III